MACPTINCHHRSPICTFIAFQGATPSPLQRCARGHPEVLWSMVAPQLPQLSGQLTALRPSSSISRRLLELEVRRYKHVQTCTNSMIYFEEHHPWKHLNQQPLVQVSRFNSCSLSVTYLTWHVEARRFALRLPPSKCSAAKKCWPNLARCLAFGLWRIFISLV